MEHQYAIQHPRPYGFCTVKCYLTAAQAGVGQACIDEAGVDVIDVDVHKDDGVDVDEAGSIYLTKLAASMSTKPAVS